jgi:phospholipid/cholesterol/gamma-HCH transport system permease protein
MPLLMVLGTVASSLSAMGVVTYIFGADGRAFIDPRFLDFGDIACAGLKAVLTGLAIPLATAAQGLRASGGAHAVGSAVTQGVIDACTGCLLLDFIIAAIFLFFGW